MTIKVEKLDLDHPDGGLPPTLTNIRWWGLSPACWPIRSGSVPG